MIAVFTQIQARRAAIEDENDFERGRTGSTMSFESDFGLFSKADTTGPMSASFGARNSRLARLTKGLREWRASREFMPEDAVVQEHKEKDDEASDVEENEKPLQKPKLNRTPPSQQPVFFPPLSLDTALSRSKILKDINTNFKEEDKSSDGSLYSSLPRSKRNFLKSQGSRNLVSQQPFRDISPPPSPISEKEDDADTVSSPQSPPPPPPPPPPSPLPVVEETPKESTPPPTPVDAETMITRYLSESREAKTRGVKEVEETPKESTPPPTPVDAETMITRYLSESREAKNRGVKEEDQVARNKLKSTSSSTVSPVAAPTAPAITQGTSAMMTSEGDISKVIDEIMTLKEEIKLNKLQENSADLIRAGKDLIKANQEIGRLKESLRYAERDRDSSKKDANEAKDKLKKAESKAENLDEKCEDLERLVTSQSAEIEQLKVKAIKTKQLDAELEKTKQALLQATEELQQVKADNKKIVQHIIKAVGGEDQFQHLLSGEELAGAEEETNEEKQEKTEADEGNEPSETKPAKLTAQPVTPTTSSSNAVPEATISTLAVFPNISSLNSHQSYSNYLEQRVDHLRAALDSSIARTRASSLRVQQTRRKDPYQPQMY